MTFCTQGFTPSLDLPGNQGTGFSDELCAVGVVLFELRPGVDVIVVVVHGAVGVEPILKDLGPVFGAIFGRVCFLGAAEDDQDFVIFRDHSL